jgi:hypothetical protein
MKNKSTVYVSAIIFIMLAVASFTSLSMAGSTVKTEDRAVSGFNKLDIGGSFTVELTQGDKESLRVEADEDQLADVVTEVKDGTLRIDQKGKGWHNKGKVKIYLTFKDLESISSSGSMDLQGKGVMKFSKLELEMSGSAKVDMQLEANSVEVDLSGSSSIKLSGRGDNMDVEISGAGDLDAVDLACLEFELEISGSGDATVNVSKKLDVTISGSGSVSYKGNPDIKKSVSGVGSIKKIG